MLPDEATSGLVHVVMNSVKPDGGLTYDDPVRMQVLPRLETRLIGSPEAQAAIQLTVEPDRREPLLAGCVECGVVVGAFEPEQLCGGCYVFAYRLRTDPGGHKIVGFFGAVISPAEAENWR